ncbi:hypothetical protein GL263_14255 [Streptomyces durbertensis]|uniref:Uncharacterized protein n=1 Tax=Streptomyces durbertensis TaxID=2448886 RepID=A0ABR6EHB7_9ACTN|nr:hypothetical protein [Streptomyces durbertensis]MBB1244720.1 hypothetical protein [Streptomyces durbertensis]
MQQSTALGGLWRHEPKRHHEPLDGDASPLVRPYLLAAERDFDQAAWQLFHTPATPC